MILSLVAWIFRGYGGLCIYQATYLHLIFRRLGASHNTIVSSGRYISIFFES